MSIEAPHERSNLNKVLFVLDSLAQVELSVADFLFLLSYGDPACTSNRRAQAARTSLFHSDKLPLFLNRWFNPPNRTHQNIIGARPTLETLALDWVAEICRKEMGDLEEYLQCSKVLNSDELLLISFTNLIEICLGKAKNLWKLLGLLATREENTGTVKHSQLFLMITCMLGYHRSPFNNRFQQLLSIYWIACGVPSKAIHLLHITGLAMSSTWIQKALNSLSKAAVQKIKDWVVDKPFAVMHDNLNIGFKAASQRISNHNHFDSGTAITILPLPEFCGMGSINDQIDFRRVWIRSSEKKTLDWGQIDSAMQSTFPKVSAMLLYHIQSFLLGHPRFETLHAQLEDSPALAKPPAVDALPVGSDFRTAQWPLRTVHIDEATYEGTGSVIEEVFRQCGLDSPSHRAQLAKSRSVPWIGDQKSVALMRHLRGMRASDLNGFDRMDWAWLIKGWFHEQMALQNQILWIYGGDIGGLDRDIKKLQRIGLAPKTRQQKPDFHHLHELLVHCLEARVLDCWLEVTGSISLDDLVKESSEWNAFQVVKFSKKILTTYVQRVDTLYPGQDDVPVDHMFDNACLFIRDALIYWELSQSIKTGDVGRMGNLIPTLLAMFAGGGNPLYAIELLEELQMELNELTVDEIRTIRHNCWLANTTGKVDHFLAMDQLQEHNIRAIKHTYRPGGPNASWEYLGKVSPLIPLFSSIKFHVEKIFGTGIRGRKHGDVDHQADIAMLIVTYQEERLHYWDPQRHAIQKRRHTNVLEEGLESLGRGDLLREWRENREKYIHATTQIWGAEENDEAEDGLLQVASEPGYISETSTDYFEDDLDEGIGGLVSPMLNISEWDEYEDLDCISDIEL